jgi:chaperonin GroEL
LLKGLATWSPAQALSISNAVSIAPQRAIETLRIVSTSEDALEKAQVGTISAHNDPVIGELCGRGDG